MKVQYVVHLLYSVIHYNNNIYLRNAIVTDWPIHKTLLVAAFEQVKQHM